MLSRAIDTHADLNRPRDREWIHILLAFLKAFVDDLGQELLMHDDDKLTYVTKMVADLRAAAEELDAGKPINISMGCIDFRCV